MSEGSDQEAIAPGGEPGWHGRGYLPHFDGSLVAQHVTFHLADSLSSAALECIEGELRRIPDKGRDVERRKKIEAWIDAGHGSCILREPAIASMVQDTLRFFDGQRYHLRAWVIMPNHVHALFQPIDGWTVAKAVASWKKFTARRIADQEIGVPRRQIWHREYWDRYMRDEEHFLRAVDYIHRNPVKAGLVARAEEWRWSSAYAGNATTGAT